jgi:hypothetical protein
MLGGERMEIDEDDDVALIKVARLSKTLAIVERPGNPAKGKPHRFTAYRVDEAEPGEWFKLDPARALFLLHARGFYSPADWHLELIEDPRNWLNEMMAAIDAALGRRDAA